MNKYIDFLNNVSVDIEMHERTIKRLNQKSSAIYNKHAVPRYAGLAACLAIIIISAFTIPNLVHKSTTSIPSDTSLIGLPAENYNLADIKMNVDMDRIVYYKLSDFFADNATQMFAFVRVTETKIGEDKNYGWSSGSVLRQEASLSILLNLWSSNVDTPETITLSQSIYGGCEWVVEDGIAKGSETTNMLRKDGVYLLPFEYKQDSGMWHVVGDLDVLFEIDDKGCVWTHSKYEDFNRFDGKKAKDLANAVIAAASN